MIRCIIAAVVCGQFRFFESTQLARSFVTFSPEIDHAADSHWQASFMHSDRIAWPDNSSFAQRALTDSDNGAMFENIAAQVFPREWYAWNHVGYPRRYAGTPVFVDLNNDSIVDFFYHNHYQMFPETDWDVGFGVPEQQMTKQNLWTSVGQRLIVSTEEPNTKYTELPIDTHGTAILDIDGDNILDMYIATGGGMGMDSGPKKHAVLMWGEQSNSSFQGAQQVFKGGRKTAEDFGLHNPNSRGRFTYFADFNHDGLLDLVFSNEARLDEINAFGYALFNDGQRQFTRHGELSEYASTMILTDADLDGRAEEFVVQRSACLPKSDPVANVTAPAPTAERLKFCESRPSGSLAIYKYNASTGILQHISPSYTRSKDGDQEAAASMQTADFDGDLKADLAVLHEEEIRIYLSSRRKPGQLPLGDPDEVIQWHRWWGENPCLGRALRVADLDLDGQEELIVMCAQLGAHLLWQRDENNHWVSRHDGVGDLQDSVKPRLLRSMLGSTCNMDSLPIYLEESCAAEAAKSKEPISSTYGMAVVDWDNNGFMDLVLTHDVGSLMMLRNTLGDQGVPKQFLAIKLQGRVGNAYGIGATVLLTARQVGRKREQTTQFREVVSASHETDWWGSKDDRIVFGLGSFGVPVKLEIRWPSPGNRIQFYYEHELKEAMNSMHSLLRVTEPAERGSI